MQNKTWQQAVITDKHNDRSYSVRTADGATYRRNRRHLIKTNECMPPETPDVEMLIPEETSPLEPQQSETPQPSISVKTRSEAVTQEKPVYITRYGRHVKSKMISNDQELIQSDPTSCPQNLRCAET